MNIVKKSLETMLLKSLTRIPSFSSMIKAQRQQTPANHVPPNERITARRIDKTVVISVWRGVICAIVPWLPSISLYIARL